MARAEALRALAVPILQSALAAALAWYLAHDVIGHQSASSSRSSPTGRPLVDITGTSPKAFTLPLLLKLTIGDDIAQLNVGSF